MKLYIELVKAMKSSLIYLSKGNKSPCYAVVDGKIKTFLFSYENALLAEFSTINNNFQCRLHTLKV